MSSRNKGLLNIVGHNVRDLRLRAGLSQEKLAELCGLHRTYIGGIERGERNITILSLEKLATGLDVSPTHLLMNKKDRRV